MILRDTALRICQERGITPAETLDEPTVDLATFRRQQLNTVIRLRYGTQLANATCDQPIVARWVQHQTADQSKYPTLVITGTTGTGKTWQAIGALKALVANHATRGKNLAWQMIGHSELGDELRGDGASSELEKYLTADLLILDDFGANMPTSWATDCTQRLVDRRWTRRMPTIYTTNLDEKALKAQVGARVHSRLGDAIRVVLTGDDRRWAK